LTLYISIFFSCYQIDFINKNICVHLSNTRKKMLFKVIVLILLSNSVLSQGVFDPSTFTQSSCTGSYSWTTWFDTNDPNMAQGDIELTSHIQQLFPSFMCSSPIAIEVSCIFYITYHRKNIYFSLLGSNFIRWESNGNWRCISYHG
jgi:hypothetical protein